MPGRSTRHRLPSRRLPPLIAFIVVSVVAEILVRLLRVPAWLLPAPSQVFLALFRRRDEAMSGFANTAAAAFIGFFVSMICGILTAIILAGSSVLRRALLPYTVFFQTVPIVAIAPLLVIWLGPGLPSVTLSTIIVSIFPVITATLAGLLGTDPALEDLFQLYRAGPLDRLLKLRLPSALPQIVTGLRVAAGLAVIGAIVSEALVGRINQNEGLGVMLSNAGRNGRSDFVFALVLLSCLLGLIMLTLVNLSGRLLLRRWHSTQRD